MLALGLAAGARAQAPPARPEVRVRLAPEVAALEAVDAGLASLRWIRRVAADEEAALRVEHGPTGFVVRDGEGAALAPPIAASDPAAARRVLAEVIGRAHRRLVASLERTGVGPDVRFTVRRASGSDRDGPLSVVEPGAELRWEARNRSPHPLFVTVFAVSPDRGVTLVHPYRGRLEALAPGESVDQEGVVDMPAGARIASDRLQLVATRERIDPALWTDPARIDAALDALVRTEWSGAHHAITVRREVAEVLPPPPDPVLDPRALDAPAEAGPTTVPGEPSPPRPRPEPPRARPPRTSRFAVHYDVGRAPELGAVQARLAKVRTLCGRGGRACEARRLFGEGPSFEIERRGRRLGEGDTQTVAEAWEQAYAMGEGLEAARAEPFLELETFGFDREAPAEAASGPAPADDWHLDHVRARDAWADLARRGRPAGREARGVRIGLADTGYRPHPEIWESADGAPAIRAGAGRDDVDGDADPSDPGLGGRALERPARGTATASVLASPTGCQLAGQPGCVHGVARGASVAALRVQRAPSHFHAGRLAGVLFDAATGGLPEPVDLVVVSPAGPPSWALWRAALRAEAAGVLVVAAAGHERRTVGWPARFPSTIAVAATGPDCRLDPDSARGPHVDVAAPGRDVWRATVGPDGTHRNAPGSGTGLAAAVTAGGAGLWLARWSASAELDALRASGGLTGSFRAALRRTRWTAGRPPAGVRCAPEARDEAVAGLDAAALLAQPPAAVDATPPLGLRDLPLWRSLQAPGAEGRAGDAYRRLFAFGPDAPLERVAWLEGEVLHHYLLAPPVTRALDAALAPDASAERWADVRAELLRRGLSDELREALEAGEARAAP